MPYNLETSRENIAKQGLDAVMDFGDLNYHITTGILAMWKAHPRYVTIHSLRKELVINPKKSKFLQNLRTEMSDRFDTEDIYTAAALAFDEFYRRIGSQYESLKLMENGDLPQYKEAIEDIALKMKEHIRKEQEIKIFAPKNEGIIIPNQGTK